MNCFNKGWLTGLDLLRFILAVVILIFHFPHFDNIHFNNFDGISLNDLSVEGSSGVLMMSLPSKNVLSLIYQYGDFAVPVFWMISGIIFYSFYLDAIKNREISFTKFLFLRFSRLYPLHILTLCSVAILQFVYLEKFGDYFIYKNNDVIYFLLNLFMINHWNAQFGYSFNGPFWSVSIEIFVYIVFFMFSYLKNLSSGNNLFYISLMFFVFYYLGILNPFSLCLLYFFTGCFLTDTIIKSKKNILISAATLFLLATIFKFSSSYADWIGINRMLNAYILLNISFFIVVSFMYLFKRSNITTKKLFRSIGNMTYAIYMIHISVQMIIILFFYEYDRQFFMNNTFLIIYIFICCLIGYAVFKYIEKPSKIFLRNRYARFEKKKA